MKSICWKGKAFKALSFGGKCKKAGRNFSGSITIFHRGGGSKKLIRRLDFRRQLAPIKGIIERIEYDPNRTARIALVRWFETKRAKSFLKREDLSFSYKFSNLQANKMVTYKNPTHYWDSSAKIRKKSPFFSFNEGKNETLFHKNEQEQKDERSFQIGESNFTPKWSLYAFSYILACDKLKSGDEIFNLENKLQNEHIFKNGFLKEKEAHFDVESLFQKSGNSLPLSLAPLGSKIHNIESFPGSGGKLARSAGTSAQLIQKMSSEPRKTFDHEMERRVVPSLGTCLIRLPSGQHRSIDMHCRATLGIVSNVEHDSHKLKKAGQTRWLGFRPVVRGVAMNPVDHPHGGGEGRTKGGRPSVSPWGKPAKGLRRKVK